VSEERAPRAEEAPLPSAERLTLHLPPDLGRRYGAIAGDRNPIHLYPWSARLFGFKRPIMHGMWTLARALRASGGEAPPATGELRVQFRRPVSLPSEVSLSWLPSAPLSDERGARFEARVEGEKVAIEGAWRAASMAQPQRA
jgi:acyl dehydratase